MKIVVIKKNWRMRQSGWNFGLNPWYTSAMRMDILCSLFSSTNNYDYEHWNPMDMKRENYKISDGKEKSLKNEETNRLWRYEMAKIMDKVYEKLRGAHVLLSSQWFHHLTWSWELNCTGNGNCDEKDFDFWQWRENQEKFNSMAIEWVQILASIGLNLKKIVKFKSLKQNWMFSTPFEIKRPSQEYIWVIFLCFLDENYFVSLLFLNVISQPSRLLILIGEAATKLQFLE